MMVKQSKTTALPLPSDTDFKFAFYKLLYELLLQSSFFVLRQCIRLQIH